MKVSKLTKIISILLIAITVLSAFSMVLGASIPTPSEPSNMKPVNDVIGIVIFVIQAIAFAAAVIMLIFVGIKFITASPEGKAEIKKIAIIYIVGAILLFAATGILEIIKGLAANVSA